MIRKTPSAGTGLLALLCDLDDQWHDGFRAWLVEDMFPARRAIGFAACASYDAAGPEAGAPPAAHRFLTLYEAPSLGDLFATPYQRLRETRDARDKHFHACFRNLDRATLTWVGPEFAAQPHSDAPDPAHFGFAPVVVVDRLAIATADVAHFNRAFVDDYLPASSRVPGLMRLRRYLTMERVPDDGANHVVIHELADTAALKSSDWMALRARATLLRGQATTSSGAAWRRIVASA